MTSNPAPTTQKTPSQNPPERNRSSHTSTRVSKPGVSKSESLHIIQSHVHISISHPSKCSNSRPCVCERKLGSFAVGGRTKTKEACASFNGQWKLICWSGVVEPWSPLVKVSLPNLQNPIELLTGNSALDGLTATATVALGRLLVAAIALARLVSTNSIIRTRNIYTVSEVSGRRVLFILPLKLQFL